MIIHRTKQIIREHRFFNKKKLGQNFLIDPLVLDQIIEKSEITSESNVLEIGAGLGSLTEALAMHAKQVVSFEIDRGLEDLLKENLSPYANVCLYFQDFLQVDLADILMSVFHGEPVCVVANVPYYITTPILFKILEYSQIKSSLLMVQKEVGQRLTGQPNTKDYNALSVYMAYKTEAAIVGKVSRKSFYPAPDVDSVLLRVDAIKSDYRLNNEVKFLKFIRELFAMRRKTLVNNLIGQYGLDKPKIEETLLELKLSKTIRSEELSLEQIIQLYTIMVEGGTGDDD
ncbi:MAG: 16S rRNA (adenine(1518)-N(6)/adenine(1519)-N(6))-dimethyltransferase RsmA [Bacilli bacterium]